MVIREPIRGRNWKANWKFKKLDDSQNTCYVLQLTLTLKNKQDTIFPTSRNGSGLYCKLHGLRRHGFLIHSHSVRFRAHQCFTPYYSKYKSIPHLIQVICTVYSDFCFLFLGFFCPNLACGIYWYYEHFRSIFLGHEHCIWKNEVLQQFCDTWPVC